SSDLELIALKSAAKGGLDGFGVKVEGAFLGIFLVLAAAASDLPFIAILQPFAEVRRASFTELLKVQSPPIARGEARAGGKRRVEQYQQRHPFTRGKKLARHFVGGEPAAGKTAEQVRSLRLHGAKLGQVIRSHLFERLMWLVVSVEAPRLQAVKWSVLPE